MKHLDRIHLRISVSGTRGKTSIVRMLASVCRSNGMRVLAKTTGSEARYIMPDGSEERVRRWGAVSIMEQKQLLRRGSRLGVDCIITELMSINPENHYAETNRLIRPHITVISNLRADHLDVVEDSTEALVSHYLNDVYPGSDIFIPSEEISDQLRSGIEKRQANTVAVSADFASEMGVDTGLHGSMFRRNIDLLASVAASLSISTETINRGIRSAKMDAGDYAIYQLGAKSKRVCFVNSFAANDPHSTMELIDKTLNTLSAGEAQIYGYLSLRSDRGERSKQWLDFLSGSSGSRFRHIYISGLSAGVLTRRVAHSSLIKTDDPAEITETIISELEDGAVVFGLANIHGRGLQLVNYWNEIGVKTE